MAFLAALSDLRRPFRRRTSAPGRHVPSEPCMHHDIGSAASVLLLICSKKNMHQPATEIYMHCFLVNGSVVQALISHEGTITHSTTSRSTCRFSRPVHLQFSMCSLISHSIFFLFLKWKSFPLLSRCTIGSHHIQDTVRPRWFLLDPPRMRPNPSGLERPRTKIT